MSRGWALPTPSTAARAEFFPYSRTRERPKTTAMEHRETAVTDLIDHLRKKA
jgi:hypothetical protein